MVKILEEWARFNYTNKKGKIERKQPIKGSREHVRWILRQGSK